VIVSFSHRGRCRNDGAFASLAGSCPIPASSGRTTRWRLNRGGDRALNRTLHTIAHSRMASCPAPATTPTADAAKANQRRDPALPEALHQPRDLPSPEHADGLTGHRSVPSHSGSSTLVGGECREWTPE
jgi:hypothetical protein